MLKIKDSVDFKKLEEYGFEIKVYDYGLMYATYDTETDMKTQIIYYVNEDDRELSIEVEEKEYYGDLCDLDILYDLIKADMVVKVEE